MNELELHLEKRTKAAAKKLAAENPEPGTPRYWILRSDYLQARAEEFRHLASVSDPSLAADYRDEAAKCAREHDRLIHEATNAWAGLS